MASIHEAATRRSHALQTLKSSDLHAQQRTMALVLSQIHSRAQRTHADASQPLSLIELIEASYAVFARHGIMTPEDARYHRLLLTLSVDPDSDWLAKIQRLCKQQQPQQRSLRRQGSADADRSKSQSSPSEARESTTPWPSPSTPSDVTSRAHSVSEHKPQDRFGDMLSFTNEMLQDDDASSLGNHSTPPREKGSRSRSASAAVLPVRFPGNRSSASGVGSSLVDRQAALNVTPMPLTAASTPRRRSARTLTPAKKTLQVAAANTTPSLDTVERRKRDERAALLASMFQRWRAMQHMKRIVEQHRQQHIQRMRAAITPMYTAAVFRWVTKTLPEQHRFQIESHAMPTDVLRRLSNILAAKELLVLYNYNQKLDRWRMKLVFRLWTRDTTKMRRFRDQALKRRHQEVLNTAFQCLRMWQYFTEMRKCETQRCAWISQKRHRHILLDCLLNWRSVFDRRQRLTMHVRTHAASKLRRACQAWRELAVKQRVRKDAMEFSRTKRGILRWKQWMVRRYLADQRALTARDHERHKIVGRHWQAWREYEMGRATTSSKLTFHQTRRRHRQTQLVFVSWLRLVAHQQVVEAKCMRFNERRWARQLSHLYQAWVEWTQRKRFQSITVQESLQELDKRRLRRVWRQWWIHLDQVELLDAQRSLAIERSRKRWLWIAWRRSIALNMALRMLTRFYRLHVLGSIALAWIQFTRRRQRIAQLEDRARLHYVRRLWRLSWLSLLHQVQTRRLQRECIENMIASNTRDVIYQTVRRWIEFTKRRHAISLRVHEASSTIRREALVGPCWDKWRQTFRWKRKLHVAVLHLQQNNRHNCFARWNTFLLGKRRQKLLFQELQLKWQRVGVIQVLKHWQLYHKQHHVLVAHSQAVHRRHRAMLLDRSWQYWRASLFTVLTQRIHVARILFKRESRSIQSCFCRWKARWSYSRRHRRLLLTMLSGSKERMLGQYFASWKGFTQERKRRQSILLDAESFHVRRLSRNAVVTWRSMKHRSHLAKLVLQQCVEHWQHRSLVLQFTRWQRFRLYRKQQAVWSKIAQCHSTRALLSGTMSAWRARIHHLQRKKARTKQTAEHMQQWRLKRAFLAWHQRSHRAKRLDSLQHHAMLSIQRGRNAMVWSQWKKFVQTKHRRRVEISARHQLMIKYQIRASVETWCKYVQMRKCIQSTLLRVESFSKEARLRHIWSQWTRFLSKQRFAHALEEKACVFHVFCLVPKYFRLWQSFHTTKRHRKQRSLRATGLLRRNHGLRAFATWVDWIKLRKQLQRACFLWRNQTLIRRWGAWARFVVQQRRKHRNQTVASAFHRQRALTTSFAMWHSTMRWSQLLRRCTQRTSSQWQRYCFDSWAKAVRINKCARALIGRMQIGVCARVFQAWKGRIRHQAEQTQRIQAQFIHLWKHDMLVKIWARWQRYSQVQATLRHKQYKSRHQTKTRVIRSWKHHVEYRSRVRNHGAQLVAITNVQDLRLMWSHWRQYQLLRGCVRFMSENAFAERERRRTRMIFQLWHEWAELSVKVTKKIQSQHHKLLQHVLLNGFCQHTLRQRQKKAVSAHLEQLHQEFACDWLVDKIHQRMSVIRICEDVKRHTHLLKAQATIWKHWNTFLEQKQRRNRDIEHFQARLRVQGGQTSGHAHQVLTRWMHLRTTKCLESWREAVSNHKQARKQNIAALERWKYVHSARFFIKWQAWCVSKKKRAVIEVLYTESKLTRVWVAWRTFVAFSFDRKQKWSNAKGFHRHRMQLTVLQEWRQHMVARRLQAHCVAECRHVRNMRLTSTLFASWAQFTMVCRAKMLQLAVVQLFRSTRLSRRLLDAWKEYVVLVKYHRNQLQLNTERLQILILCASFRAWHDWSSKQRKLIKAVHIFGWRCDTKTAKSAFSAWHQYVQGQRTLDWKIVTFQQHRACKRAVHSWQKFALAQKQQSETHQRAKRFLSMMKGQQLACRFLRWKLFSIQARQHRTALRHYYTKLLLPKYWYAWQSVVQNKHQQQDRLKRLVAQWTHDTLRRAWLAMRVYHLARRQRQDTLLTADAHFLDARLRCTIKRWRTTTSTQKHNLIKTRTVLMRWRLRTFYQCFLRWQMFHGKIKALQFQLDVVNQNADRQRMMGSWCNWRKLYVVQRAGARRLLLRVWGMWRNRYRLHRVRVLLQGKTERSTQRHMLMQWRKFVYNSKLKQTMMLMCSGLSNTQIVKRMWLHWHRFVVTSRSNKLKIGQVLLHIQCRRLFAILKSLQTNAMLERHKRSELKRAHQFNHQRLQNRCWRAWKAYVDIELSHRAKLKFCINMLQHSRQKKRFTLWKAFTNHQQLIKRNLATLFTKRSQLNAQKVFDGWRVFVTKEQQRIKAQNLCDSTRARYVLKHWRQYIVICKMERMMGASRARQIEAMFLMWRKVVVKTKQVRRLQKNVRLSGELAQQRVCFQNWCQWSRLHARVKRILMSAAFNHRLRFRFLLWKQFIGNRQRLKMMLVGDAARLLQQEAEFTFIEQNTGTIDQTIPSATHQAALVACVLARKARFFQRLELDWSDLTQVWPRWRHAFHAKLFYRLRKVHAPLIRWQHWASRQRMHRLAIDSSQRRHCIMILQSHLSGWRSVVAGVKQLQQQRKRDRELWTIINTEMIRKDRKMLKLHWRRWSAYVEEKRHLQHSLDMYHKARLVTKFWLLWSREYLQTLRQSRQQERIHRSHLERTRLQRSVKRWKARAAYLKRRRLVLEYFANRNYDRSVALVVLDWRRWVRYKRRIRQFTVRHARRNAVHWLRTWRSRMLTAKKHQKQLQCYSAKRTMRLKATLWMHWRHFLHRCHARADAMIRAECHYLQQRLRLRWLAFVHAECDFRNRVQDSRMRLQTWNAQRVARRWHSQSAKARRKRQSEQFILRKHLKRWQWHVRLALAFRYDNERTLCRARKICFAWRQWTRQHRTWRRIVWDEQITRDLRYMATAWTEWQRRVERTLAKKTAIQHWAISSRRMALQQWYAAVERCRGAREDRMEKAALHATHISLRACWLLWLRGMQVQQRKRAALLACMVKLNSQADKRLVEVLWRAWLTGLHREQQCRALLATRGVRTRQRALVDWKAWLQHKRSRSQQYASADRYFATRLLSMAFFYWQNYALAWKDVVKEQHTQPPVLRMPLPIATSSSSCVMETVNAVAVGERPMSPVMKRLRQTHKPGQQLTVRAIGVTWLD